MIKIKDNTEPGCSAAEDSPSLLLKGLKQHSDQDKWNVSVSCSLRPGSLIVSLGTLGNNLHSLILWPVWGLMLQPAGH